MFDVACYNLIRRDIYRFVFALAIANYFYCVLSALIILIHLESLTTFGYIYFILEIVVILALTGIEMRAARHLKMT